MKKLLFLAVLFALTVSCSSTKEPWHNQYDVVWNSQSKNSSESMPLSGGGMGCNVWVENNQLMFYFAGAGCRDENGALLKYGRVRITSKPDIFSDASFEQKLHLGDGAIYIKTSSPTIGNTTIKLWSEMESANIHVEATCDKDIELFATFESWREEPLLLPEHRSGKTFKPHYERSIGYSNLVGSKDDEYIYNDTFESSENSMLFYHRMRNDVRFFKKQMEQQNLTAIKDKLYDPVKDLTFGGTMIGDNLSFVEKTRGTYVLNDFVGFKYKTTPRKTQHLKIVTHISQTPTVAEWKNQLDAKVKSAKSNEVAWNENKAWWKEFWDRSHIVINEGRGTDDIGWQVGRNYNLFRYMLASGYKSNEPLMFNGGLFTFDPSFEGKEFYESSRTSIAPDSKGYDATVQNLPSYTPDFRRWGAALTAQNQRLVYFPMLRSGDYDLAAPAMDWYLDRLQNTKAAAKHYWNIDGCINAEQPNISGIIGMSEYSWTNSFTEGSNKYRPTTIEDGIPACGIRYIFISQLEYSWYMFEYSKFSGREISKYLPFIEQSVIFYDEFYRMKCKEKFGTELYNGKLHFYPSNALEGNPEATNPNCVIFGLKAVLGELITLPDSLQSPEKKARWREMLSLLPDHPLGEKDGKQYYKIAEDKDIKLHKLDHAPELYGLYPFKQIGLGDNLDKLRTTLDIICSLDPNYNQHSRGWTQNTVHYALIGESETARKLVVDKIENGPYRFPAFFPGGDYAPDHNVGGAGIIGLQEMLLQSRNNEIRVLPAWCSDWDVDYKLYAPYETVQCSYKDGKVTSLDVTHNCDESVVINK